MDHISRKDFLNKMGLLGAGTFLWPQTQDSPKNFSPLPTSGVTIDTIKPKETIFEYIKRKHGSFNLTAYQKIIGAANEFKEGDASLGVAAKDIISRERARQLLGNTSISELDHQSVYTDDLYRLIKETTKESTSIGNWTLTELKEFTLIKDEGEIKAIMPELTSDCIGCLVKLMTNEELIGVGQKVFNPLENSKIGSKGYLSARVQPNSPTDNPEDIIWQVFNAWSYAVGDLVLGTNPVSSEVESVAKIEQTLFDVLKVFGLEKTMSNCVLSHIDVQAEVEKIQPGTTGIWFQSLAGTVNANRTFDLSIEKMHNHVKNRTGLYGLYAETGQGADFTNGHGAGFDMVLHESRKYGFLRALDLQFKEQNVDTQKPWVHVNDVAGFIGPEVFKSKEQLVRCCLEDIVMGKLHGLTIGLDVCSTLHMDVSLDDLDWCIDQIMPANPAYLMALPTKNDPMLSYLTTSFSDHVRVRAKFGYKINDAMWQFFKDIEIIDHKGQPTANFGNPTWVYFKYCQAKGDQRDYYEIKKEGENSIERIRQRGVPISEGFGEHIWNLEPELEKQVRWLYEDAKKSLWSNMTDTFIKTIPAAIPIITSSKDRQDYVYHPESGEKLTSEAISVLTDLKAKWKNNVPDIQFIISDGLNPLALMDDGHLLPYLSKLKKQLTNKDYSVNKENIIIKHGRVRAGYACGEILYGEDQKSSINKAIVHIIGERPGSGHHNFSAYLTAAPRSSWSQPGMIDHNITKVVSGISDTSLTPDRATEQTLTILDRLFTVI
ncbi:ethanolamine ammonia-lyase subunit EutB [Cytophaga sp. FL35]|uniref:ethanolamine ammonia-lyase subunit EutB n=1 Tax=Cytophaga sp. FL35 TaxID=1904456 RepID=UPI001653EBAF|nr:ethanolamine ammonia-lyase subunit EutB [Cytophaga sp. FL35]MBC6998507.1 ethanolamine ammonia-lyase subunit EutB [Cytophaga sp. FL35]